MKIYEIGTGYTPIPAEIGAATEIVVEELTKAFLKQGADVEIIDIAADSRKENDLPIREVKIPKCFTETDVKLGLMHKLKRVVYSIALSAELKKILRETDEKVVLHFHNQYNLFFFLKLASEKLRRRCVIAYTNHSGIWRLPWEEIENTIKKRYFQEAECMKQADIVFVLNQETKDQTIEHLKVPRGRLVVIGNGVNMDVYHPLTEEGKLCAKEKYGLKGRNVILQVGSVYENKGQLRAVQHLEPLMKCNPDLIYAYAGGIVDEAYHQQLLSYVKDHGLVEQVRYLGMVAPGSKLNEMYNMAKATILPSRYEGFPLVVIESLAAGVPVLLNRQALFHMGAGCVRYDEAVFAMLVEGTILGAVPDEYAKLCASARNNAVNNHSWDAIAQNYRTAWET